MLYRNYLILWWVTATWRRHSRRVGDQSGWDSHNLCEYVAILQALSFPVISSHICFALILLFVICPIYMKLIFYFQLASKVAPAQTLRKQMLGIFLQKLRKLEWRKLAWRKLARFLPYKVPALIYFAHFYFSLYFCLVFHTIFCTYFFCAHYFAPIFLFYFFIHFPP